MWWEGLKCLNVVIDVIESEVEIDMAQLATSNVVVFDEKQYKLELWPLIHTFSDFSKLIRVTAYALRFISNIRARLGNKVLKFSKLFNLDWMTVSRCDILEFSGLRTAELRRAQFLWVYLVQRSVYFPEISHLLNNLPISKDSSLFMLCPFMDDGLLRMGSRLTNASLTFDEKFPVIVPESGKFPD